MQCKIDSLMECLGDVEGVDLVGLCDHRVRGLDRAFRHGAGAGMRSLWRGRRIRAAGRSTQLLESFRNGDGARGTLTGSRKAPRADISQFRVKGSGAARCVVRDCCRDAN